MTTQLELDKWQMNKNTDDICKNYHKGNEQSVAANMIAAPFKVSTRVKIILALKTRGDQTCEELEKELQLSHQACSARISELKRDGLIRKIGTRPTRSGCQAAVYQAL
jgi:predicted transcriptional regulator